MPTVHPFGQLDKVNPQWFIQYNRDGKKGHCVMEAEMPADWWALGKTEEKHCCIWIVGVGLVAKTGSQGAASKLGPYAPCLKHTQESRHFCTTIQSSDFESQSQNPSKTANSCSPRFHFSGQWLQPWWYIHLSPEAAMQDIRKHFACRDERGTLTVHYPIVFDGLIADECLFCSIELRATMGCKSYVG